MYVVIISPLHLQGPAGSLLGGVIKMAAILQKGFYLSTPILNKLLEKVNTFYDYVKPFT